MGEDEAALAFRFKGDRGGLRGERVWEACGERRDWRLEDLEGEGVKV